MQPLAGAEEKGKPALEGIDWYKSTSKNRKERFICLGKKCNPSEDGYSALTSLNKHFKTKHKDAVFAAPNPQGAMGNASTEKPPASVASRHMDGTRRIHTRRDNGCEQARNRGIARVERKRPCNCDVHDKLPRQRGDYNAADTNPVPKKIEEMALKDGVRERKKRGLREGDPSARNKNRKETAGEGVKGSALLNLTRSIDIPIYGISSISYVSTVSPGKTSTNLMAKWLPDSAAGNTAAKGVENQSKETGKIPIDVPIARFPIIGSPCNILAEGSPKEKDGKLQEHLGFQDFLQSVKDKASDSMDWKLEATKELQGGEWGVPLVDYLDSDIN